MSDVLPRWPIRTGHLPASSIDNQEDTTLPTIGIIFALCLSLYMTTVMMRRLWHRYQLRVHVVAERIV